MPRTLSRRLGPEGGAFLRGQDARGAVRCAVQQVQDDALAEPALADLERLSEELRQLLEQQHARGQDANAARIELEALRDLEDGVARQDPDRPLQGLVLERRADEGPERLGA